MALCTDSLEHLQKGTRKKVAGNQCFWNSKFEHNMMDIKHALGGSDPPSTKDVSGI